MPQADTILEVTGLIPSIEIFGELINQPMHVFDQSANGDKSAEEIASLFNTFGVQSVHIFQSLNLMFENGILDGECQFEVEK